MLQEYVCFRESYVKKIQKIWETGNPAQEKKKGSFTTATVTSPDWSRRREI